MKTLYALVLTSCLVSPIVNAEKKAEVWYNSSGEAALVTWEEVTESPESVVDGQVNPILSSTTKVSTSSRRSFPRFAYSNLKYNKFGIGLNRSSFSSGLRYSRGSRSYQSRFGTSYNRFSSYGKRGFSFSRPRFSLHLRR